jgi:hypothetical protein
MQSSIGWEAESEAEGEITDDESVVDDDMGF